MSFKNCKVVAVGVNPKEYHAGRIAVRGDPNYVMSASSLKEFGACPEEWRRVGNELLELNVELDVATSRQERDKVRAKIERLTGDSKLKRWGSAVDCRWLTPQHWDSNYALRPTTVSKEVLECPECGSQTESKTCRKCRVDRVRKTIDVAWSGLREECAEWLDATEQSGREVITSDELEEVDKAVAVLRSKPWHSKALQCSDVQVHVQGEWHDPCNVIVPVRCLLDFVPKLDTEWTPDLEIQWGKTLGDLKTTGTADLLEFSRRVERFGWHIQAAWNMDLYVAATGEDRTDFWIAGQKNYGVYQPFKRLLTQDYLTLGREAYQRLMGNYCWCLNHDRWPDPDETDEAIFGMGQAAPLPFMAEKAAFAPRFASDEDDTEL